MKNLKIKYQETGRREFISKISALAAMGLINPAINENHLEAQGSPLLPAAELPTIALGTHRVSRLICGSNPLLGYSYMGHHTDQHMKEYFTTERTVEFLLRCEQAGITTHQTSTRLDYFQLLREKGSKLKIIYLETKPERINEVADVAKPIAIVHHGGMTDRLFSEGKSGMVRDFVKKVKDKGLLAGVSAHNPNNIKQIADEGWENDLFMTCFYYLTRKPDSNEPSPILPVGSYSFYRDDPKVMTEVVRQVNKPCLGFKIMGAGRLASSQEKVRAAFKFAFENIKPTDGIVVGMFPWYFDEIGANAQYARELGS